MVSKQSPPDSSNEGDIDSIGATQEYTSTKVATSTSIREEHTVQQIEMAPYVLNHPLPYDTQCNKTQS